VSERDFLSPAAREAARRAVVEAEAETSAEIVVSVRRLSGRYREADYLFGFAVSLLALLALLFLPQEFPLWVFAPDVALGFAAGAFACSRLPPLRRLLTSPRVREANVRQASRAAFLDGGLSRLPRRNAVLVYVGLFERRVDVVADVGIDTGPPDAHWSEALDGLAGALRPRPDYERFLAALRGMGRALGRVHPRSEDDVNELPDEVLAE
jgi:putative membrane protein